MNDRLSESFSRIYQLSRDRPSNKDQIRDKIAKLDKVLHSKPYLLPQVEKSSPDDNIGRSQTEIERRRVDKRLKGFVVKDSRAWKQICSHYGTNLNQVELLSIAEVLGHVLHIRVDREAKRRKEVLIKWFEENIEAIEPMLDRLIPEDKNGNDLSGKQ